MRTRPTPEHRERIPIGYEVDQAFFQNREAFIQRSPEMIELFLRAHAGMEHEVVLQKFRGDDGCYQLMQRGRNKSATLEDIRKARAKIALHIGVTPAPLHRFLPEYDPDFAKIFRYSFSIQCQNHGRNCIRPSHLILCTWDGHPLRPLNREVS